MARSPKPSISTCRRRRCRRRALRELDIDPGAVGLHYDGGFRDPVIEYIARAVYTEMVDSSPGGKMLAETLALALGVQILRRHSNLEPASVSLPGVRGALDARRLRRVVDYIETHLAEDLTIEALAGVACLSPFHFARAFKAATGEAPHRYLTDRRIGRARALLADGRLPLGEIAERVRIFLPAAFHLLVQAPRRHDAGRVQGRVRLELVRLGRKRSGSFGGQSIESLSRACRGDLGTGAVSHGSVFLTHCLV